jgi:hypothetical protein
MERFEPTRRPLSRSVRGRSPCATRPGRARGKLAGRFSCVVCFVLEFGQGSSSLRDRERPSSVRTRTSGRPALISRRTRSSAAVALSTFSTNSCTDVQEIIRKPMAAKISRQTLRSKTATVTNDGPPGRAMSGRSVVARKVTVRRGSLRRDREERMTTRPGRARGSFGAQGRHLRVASYVAWSRRRSLEVPVIVCIILQGGRDTTKIIYHIRFVA